MSTDKETRPDTPPPPSPAPDRAGEEAIAWYVRLKDPGATDADRTAFAVWLDATAENRRAYAEAGELWSRLAEPAARLGAGGWYRAPSRRLDWRWAGSRRAGRGWMGARAWASFALAASVLLAAVGLWWRDPGLADRLLADYATAPGERREAVLADGSRLLLDADSAVSVTITGTERRVDLRRGRVWLDVAHDPALGFRVVAGSVEARVLGTAFEVDRQTGQGLDAVIVTVERGRVAVDSANGPAEGVVLSAGQRARVAPGVRTLPQTVSPDTAFAWRRGLVLFDRVPLAEVAVALDRMSKGRVLIPDETLRGLTLSGVFRADDPDAVLDALRSALGIRTTVLPGMATLIHR